MSPLRSTWVSVPAKEDGSTQGWVRRESVGAWPAGTTGAVISAYDDTLLVEITGPGGKTLDTIQAPAARLDVKHA